MRRMQTLILHGWGQDNPAFRQVFTSGFIPEGTPEQIRWMNELMRVSTSPQNAVRLQEALSTVDIRDRLRHGACAHARPSQPQRWTCLIPEGAGARAWHSQCPPLTLESKNHLLLEHEPEFPRFMEAIREFLRSEAA